jgi:peptide/nickel transport system permease protein
VSEPTEFQKAWQRFRRNRPAFAGLSFVLLSILVAIIGYGLSPDQAPDANTQIPSLALTAPGARAQLLSVKLNRWVQPVSYVSLLISGRPVTDLLIPIVPGSLRLERDSVYFQPIGDVGHQGSVHVLQLFFPVFEELITDTTAYVFKDATGLVQRISKAHLVDNIKNGMVISNRYFMLGTDKYGRCNYSRLLLGCRVSLLVGLISVFISLTIGLFLGLVGGYFGGKLDEVVLLLINTAWSIPTLLLVFAIVMALGRGVGVIFLAVGLTMWVDVARMVRGQTLSLRSLPFVEAAQSMGFGHWRIIRRHIMPNLLGPVLVVAAGNFATAILVESGLSYLGFGVQPPTPSWGSMLNENYGYAISGKPLLALAPAIAIALMVLAFNLVGNGLRDALDVKG